MRSWLGSQEGPPPQHSSGTFRPDKRSRSECPSSGSPSFALPGRPFSGSDLTGRTIEGLAQSPAVDPSAGATRHVRQPSDPATEKTAPRRSLHVSSGDSGCRSKFIRAPRPPARPVGAGAVGARRRRTTWRDTGETPARWSRNQPGAPLDAAHVQQVMHAALQDQAPFAVEDGRLFRGWRPQPSASPDGAPSGLTGDADLAAASARGSQAPSTPPDDFERRSRCPRAAARPGRAWSAASVTRIIAMGFRSRLLP